MDDLICGRRGWVFLTFFGAMAAASCGGAGEPPAFTVRDSSGVEVVESYRPGWAPDEGRRIGAEPLLRIGVLQGDPDYQFDGVTGAALLVDGGVVVADFGYQNVRFFSSDGRLTAAFGGPGEGPAEFQGLSAMGSSADGRIWAYDFMLRRFTWLDQAGRMSGLATLDPEPAMLHPLGILEDGSFLLKQLWGAAQVAQATETGFRRDPVAFVRFDSEGTLLDTLCLLPGRELVLTDEGGRGVMSTPPFAKNAAGAIWNGAALVGSTEALDLSVVDSRGGTTRIVRLPALDLAVRQQDREDFFTGRLEGVPQEERAAERARLEAMPFPDRRPAFGALLAGKDGTLWVGDWALAPETPGEWKVFDSSGKWLGTVEVPDRFFPYDIGEDRILGVEWDDLDVEYVVIYPLLKGPPNG